MRPRVHARLPIHRVELVKRVEAAFKAADSTCLGTISSHQLTFRIADKERHFWSPFLDLEIVEKEDSVELFGLYGPHPDVWGLFLGFQAVAVFSAIAGIVLGLCQWSLGEYPWGGFILGGSCAFGLCIYFTSLLGQRIGASQVAVIEQFLRTTAAVPFEELSAK